METSSSARPTSEPAENCQTDQSPKPRLFKLSQVLGDFRADADAAHEARTTGKPRGALSGLSTLDRELSGAFANGLHILHGNAGTGKTALALQIAATCQCPALFVTCEMSPVELLRRHTARVTGTYLGRLKSGEMRGQDAEAMALQAIEAAPHLAFVDATRAPARPEYLQECALIVRGQSKHFLLVIDSLHTWTQSTAADGAQEYEALNTSITSLQRLAANLACPLLMISERNRDSMKSGGLNAGAGTRKIEYQGETVIDLDRQSDAQENGAGEVEVTLRLAKNRHGSIGKPLPLRFNGALQKFTESEGGAPGEPRARVGTIRNLV
jgi:replicative DNA helicase